VNKKYKRFIMYSIGTLIIGISLTVGLLNCDRGPIQNFNYERDRAGVLANLKEDIYWLVEEPKHFDQEYMLRTMSPDKDPSNYGKLHIKVLRDDNQVAGFVTYHKLNSNTGRVQFLSVNKKFRGKGYGKILLNYAVQDLFKIGCNKVVLVTRTSNIWAQRIYKTLGFKEYHRTEDGFVDFVIYK